MNATERREHIIEVLQNSRTPVTAQSLADRFEVSRQVIVGDIALIRASGIEVTSLSRGYILKRSALCTKVFKLLHSDEQVADELGTIVDLGGTVEDVFVFHRVYGKLAAVMDIKNRADIQSFLDEIASGKSSLLKNVTSGYHYHTVSAPNWTIIEKIEKALMEKGYIAPLKPYEPIDIKDGRY